jgi:hypothetical protein
MSYLLDVIIEAPSSSLETSWAFLKSLRHAAVIIIYARSFPINSLIHPDSGEL